jgi:hypothetical protein
VFASEEDVFFPARAVLPWVREIFPNLVHARCLKGASHVPSKADASRRNRRYPHPPRASRRGLADPERCRTPLCGRENPSRQVV